jgi:hypothetical protein
MIIYRNKTQKRTAQLSVRIQLIEGLFVKRRPQSAGLTFVRQDSGLSKRKKCYQQDSTNCKEIKITEAVCLY